MTVLDKGVKQRIVGALVLVALAVVFLPMLFTRQDEVRQVHVEAPQAPAAPKVADVQVEQVAVPEPQALPEKTMQAPVVVAAGPVADACRQGRADARACPSGERPTCRENGGDGQGRCQWPAGELVDSVGEPVQSSGGRQVAGHLAQSGLQRLHPQRRWSESSVRRAGDRTCRGRAAARRDQPPTQPQGLDRTFSARTRLIRDGTPPVVQLAWTTGGPACRRLTFRLLPASCSGKMRRLKPLQAAMWHFPGSTGRSSRSSPFPH